MSTHYSIWKESGEFPWRFEGDEWGDCGSSATFADAIAVTVGERRPKRVAS